jgi:hypothetical protein
MSARDHRAAMDDWTLDALSWMTGYWVDDRDGARAEELWTHASGDLMLGLSRTTRDGGRVFFEFLRIERTSQGIVYLASPAGQPATPFALAECEGRRAVFANPEHDHPQRIIYWREDDDSLCARIESQRDGQIRASSWTWRSAEFPPDQR